MSFFLNPMTQISILSMLLLGDSVFAQNEQAPPSSEQEKTVPVTFKTMDENTVTISMNIVPALKFTPRHQQTIAVMPGKYTIRTGVLMTRGINKQNQIAHFISGGQFEVTKETTEIIFGPTNELTSTIKKQNDRTIKITNVFIVGKSNEIYRIIGQQKPPVIQTFLKYEDQEKHQTNMTPG